VIPFHVIFRPGETLHGQITYAAKKAMMSGRLRPGDPFPSVRAMSKELKINPNTAHKVISNLVAAGLLETRPGQGSIVATRQDTSKKERVKLIYEEAEQLTVEAMRLNATLDDLIEAITEHWERLKIRKPASIDPQRGGR
jgi:GntR family transcriptional regulator